MTGLAWASLLVTPVALGLFIPCVTYVYLALRRRSIQLPGLRAMTGDDILQPRASRGDILIAIFFVAVTQLLATGLLLDGFGEDPYAGWAVVSGVSEWVIAMAWLALLVTRSSPVE